MLNIDKVLATSDQNIIKSRADHCYNLIVAIIEGRRMLVVWLDLAVFERPNLNNIFT
jgi:hypothetical protein